MLTKVFCEIYRNSPETDYCSTVYLYTWKLLRKFWNSNENVVCKSTYTTQDCYIILFMVLYTVYYIYMSIYIYITELLYTRAFIVRYKTVSKYIFMLYWILLKKKKLYETLFAMHIKHVKYSYYLQKKKNTATRRTEIHHS